MNAPLSTFRLRGAGLTIAADAAGSPTAPVVLFLPGGGQTRAAWGHALPRVAAAGFRAIATDLRGHGESDWAADRDYRLSAHAADLRAMLEQLDRPVMLVGASLGGLAALTVAADAPGRVAGLVLVDVVPRVARRGTDRVRAFMTAHPGGFATIEDAAAAIAAYLPHRPRPKDLSGLGKNLRRRADGRHYWHWDPAISDDARYDDPDGPLRRPELLEEAASALTVPVLLIRGGSSEVVSPEGAAAFLALVPHAEYVNVAGADHMVAGDRNDAFLDAALDFLTRHAAGRIPPAAPPR